MFSIQNHIIKLLTYLVDFFLIQYYYNIVLEVILVVITLVAKQTIELCSEIP